MSIDYTPYMKLAIKLAKKAEGMTSPNPLVGAVIIDENGRIIGKGFHRMAGQPHAEVMALKDAGKIPHNSTMIVNLEPCNHFGRTPPCTLAIKQAGIKRVVIANKDPNPNVKGGGTNYLRRAGIEVIDGVCEKEASKLNEAYFKHVKTSLPFISLKIAMGIDGRIAAHDGSSKWITSESSRRMAHRLRNIVDAIVIGVGTIKKDNPELTVRYSHVRHRPLYRVIFDANLSTPIDAHVIRNQDDIYKTMILTSKDTFSKKAEMIKKFVNNGVEVISLDANKGMISIQDALNFLGKRFMHILVEGGAGITGSFVRLKQFDKLHIFIAPKLIGEDGLYPFKGLFLGNINNAIRLKDISIRRSGDDCFIQGYPEW